MILAIGVSLIPLNEKDVLDFRNTISRYPDDNELNIWLSWMHYPIYITAKEIAENKKKLLELEFKLSCLESNIFLSLNKEDYPSLKTRKTVVKGRDDVIKLKKEIETCEHELTISEIKFSKYKKRNITIQILAANRANTSNYQENIDFIVRSRKGIRG